MKYIPVCVVIFSLLIATASSSENDTEDSSSVLSFTFEAWDPLGSQWKSSTGVEKGSRIRLICTIDRHLSHTFDIRRLNGTDELTPLERPNRRQVVHEIVDLDCDHLGIYVCENGRGAHSTLELGVFNCEPRFCDPKTESKITTTAVPYKSKTFSVCVFAYPDIIVDKVTPDLDLAKRSVENEIGSPGHSDTTPNAKEGSALSDWSFELEQDLNSFGVFSVNITKTRVSKEDYGEHTFAIFTIHRGQRKQLNYTILLKPIDPPDCPKHIAVSSRSFHEVKLVWQPGLGRGVQQLFSVFYSSDNQTWHKYDKDTTNNSITVKGLKQDTLYAFRIGSGNEFMEDTDETRCPWTVYDKTERLPPYYDCADDLTTQSQSPSPTPNDVVPVWAIVLIAVIFVFGILVIACLFVLLKRGNLPWNQREEMNQPVSVLRQTDINEANSDCLIPTDNLSQEHIYEEAD